MVVWDISYHGFVGMRREVPFDKGKPACLQRVTIQDCWLLVLCRDITVPGWAFVYVRKSDPFGTSTKKQAISQCVTNHFYVKLMAVCNNFEYIAFKGCFFVAGDDTAAPTS